MKRNILVSSVLSLALAFVIGPAHSESLPHESYICPALTPEINPDFVTTCQSMLEKMCIWTTYSSGKGICKNNKKLYSGCCYDEVTKSSTTFNKFCRQHTTPEACAGDKP